MPFLGIPLWVWITGGTIAGGAVLADQTGDAAEQIGDATEKATGLAQWVVAGMALYLAYSAAKSAGVFK
jgi:hypothetical protein